MGKIDKVIASLRCCNDDPHCESCGYKGQREEGKTCLDLLMEDAFLVILDLKTQVDVLREWNYDLRRELAAGVLRSMPNDWGEYPPEFPREGM